MQTLYRIRQDVGLVDEVDDKEKLKGPGGEILPNGTEFLIFNPKHEWSVHPNAAKLHFYTIQVLGRHYNVLANLLEPAMEQVGAARL
jgi:hypothetical protein